MRKRLATDGKKKAWRKKRKYELGRQSANPKLSTNKTSMLLYSSSGISSITGLTLVARAAAAKKEGEV
ncbi:hypothetical protein Goari_015021, partial [Gossypium aridum]|nr:hypothetical protein [Gossypium aridum]